MRPQRIRCGYTEFFFSRAECGKASMRPQRIRCGYFQYPHSNFSILAASMRPQRIRCGYCKLSLMRHLPRDASMRPQRIRCGYVHIPARRGSRRRRFNEAAANSLRIHAPPGPLEAWQWCFNEAAANSLRIRPDRRGNQDRRPASMRPQRIRCGYRITSFPFHHTGLRAALRALRRIQQS